MIVTFCGHGKEQYNALIQEKLYILIESLILKGANEFLIGGYGNFDMLATTTVKKLKKKYPYIKSILVIPYIDRKFDTTLFDGSEYPPIENVPKRFAILKRNKWMIDKADIVVAYITHSWGGASKMYEYAVRNKKAIITLH